MIREVVFGGKGWEEAKGALDAGALRQRVLASNVANVATPGYRAQEVVFEEMLSSEESKLRMQTTQPGHLTGAKSAPVPRPLTQARGGPVDASGVNDVSVEQEMTEMTENTVHFQALSLLLANKYRAIRDSIRPGA
jgi:flagellar basal-body rod protein FlgB